MRMWMVDPRMLCRKHLLAEHLEVHMFHTAIVCYSRIDGYMRNGLVEPQNVSKRHEALVAEMLSRGYNHKSPMPELVVYDEDEQGHVPVKRSIRILWSRCPDCRSRIREVLSDNKTKP